MLTNNYIKPLKELFAANANPENTGPMKEYMRSQFEFFGIKTPERRALTKAFFKKNGLPPPGLLQPVVKELWELPQREYQYFIVGLLRKIMESREPLPLPPQEMIELFEYVITSKSWWDTVDGIASWAVGGFLQKYPEFIKPCTDKWLKSGNIWLQRTAVLFQLDYKDKTDETLLFNTIKQLTHSNEFFIQKAIGWALREYSKTSPQKVIEFVQQTPMAPLSKREALKVVNKKQR
jgi:3-methyladenine DNA glycosylase AlkD